MSLWLKNGRILVLNGNAVECDYCPCDEPSGSSGSSSQSSSGCACGTADWVYSAHPLNRWDLVTNNCTGGGTPVEPNYTPTGAPWTATTCCEGCEPSGSSSSGSSVSSSGSGDTVSTCVCDGIGTPSVITLTADGASIPLTYSPSIGSLGGWAGSGWVLEIGSFCLLGLTSPSCGGITWYPDDYPFGNEFTLYYACSPLYMSGTIENQVIGCAPISVEITL